MFRHSTERKQRLITALRRQINLAGIYLVWSTYPQVSKTIIPEVLCRHYGKAHTKVCSSRHDWDHRLIFNQLNGQVGVITPGKLLIWDLQKFLWVDDLALLQQLAATQLPFADPRKAPKDAIALCEDEGWCPDIKLFGIEDEAATSRVWFNLLNGAFSNKWVKDARSVRSVKQFNI